MDHRCGRHQHGLDRPGDLDQGPGGRGQELESCCLQRRGAGFHVETGEFGADMLVESVNNGPVTILLDTREL